MQGERGEISNWDMGRDQMSNDIPSPPPWDYSINWKDNPERATKKIAALTEKIDQLKAVFLRDKPTGGRERAKILVEIKILEGQRNKLREKLLQMPNDPNAHVGLR